MDRIELLKAIYNAIEWDRLYELAPGADRQRVDELFQDLREALGELPDTAGERAAALAGGAADLYCDGASKGNPGPAGIGMVLKNPEGEEVVAWGAAIGEATNNVAEYRAALAGLKVARDLGVRRVRIMSDSELLIRQLNGEYRVRHPGLKPLHAEIQQLLADFESWEARSISRDENARADALASQHARPARQN